MVHVHTSSSRKWLPWLGALTALTLVGSWWGREQLLGPDSAVSSATPVQAAPTPAAGPAPVLLQQMPQATAEEQQAAQVILTQQAEAAQKLEQERQLWQPLKGTIKERPGFVSLVEWQMLKGVSEQQADPQAELNRLVNFLRFTKLQERWQDLPANADPALRQALAVQLSGELPLRVKQGEVELKDAQQQLHKLLQDAYPDTTQRTQAQKRLASELSQAAASPTR